MLFFRFFSSAMAAVEMGEVDEIHSNEENIKG